MKIIVIGRNKNNAASSAKTGFLFRSKNKRNNYKNKIGDIGKKKKEDKGIWESGRKRRNREGSEG